MDGAHISTNAVWVFEYEFIFGNDTVSKNVVPMQIRMQESESEWRMEMEKEAQKRQMTMVRQIST